MTRAAAALLAAVAIAGCTRETAAPGTVAPPTTTPTTAAPTTVLATTVPVPPTAPTTPAPPTSATTTTTATTATTAPDTVPASAAPPAVADGTTAYVVPVVDVAGAGWSPDHAGYPATDVFLPCGATIVSPVDGTLLEVRRVDGWSEAVDNPATRGGRSIAILGDDGVRYYLAHFDTILDGLEPGVRVAAGAELGAMGRTGRTSACHLHMGISPPCPGKEWSVRRGVVWPYPYLDAWRSGDQASPADEVARWLSEHPTACVDAMADPNAPDA